MKESRQIWFLGGFFCCSREGSYLLQCLRPKTLRTRYVNLEAIHSCLFKISTYSAMSNVSMTLKQRLIERKKHN